MQFNPNRAVVAVPAGTVPLRIALALALAALGYTIIRELPSGGPTRPAVPLPPALPGVGATLLGLAVLGVVHRRRAQRGS